MKHASRYGRVPQWILPDANRDECTRKTFGDYVIARRNELGMTQRQLAQVTGIRQAAICEIETGAIDPRLTTMARLLHALDCAVGPVPSFLMPYVAAALSSSTSSSAPNRT
ncbi:MAG: helix-turn-helix domain-containing protein [Terriglobales bacterium]